jgi:hypothetical protein
MAAAKQLSWKVAEPMTEALTVKEVIDKITNCAATLLKDLRSRMRIDKVILLRYCFCTKKFSPK